MDNYNYIYPAENTLPASSILFTPCNFMSISVEPAAAEYLPALPTNNETDYSELDSDDFDNSLSTSPLASTPDVPTSLTDSYYWPNTTIQGEIANYPPNLQMSSESETLPAPDYMAGNTHEGYENFDIQTSAAPGYKFPYHDSEYALNLNYAPGLQSCKPSSMALPNSNTYFDNSSLSSPLSMNSSGSPDSVEGNGYSGFMGTPSEVDWQLPSEVDTQSPYTWDGLIRTPICEDLESGTLSPLNNQQVETTEVWGLYGGHVDPSEIESTSGQFTDQQYDQPMQYSKYTEDHNGSETISLLTHHWQQVTPANAAGIETDQMNNPYAGDHQVNTVDPSLLAKEVIPSNGGARTMCNTKRDDHDHASPLPCSHLIELTEVMKHFLKCHNLPNFQDAHLQEVVEGQQLRPATNCLMGG